MIKLSNSEHLICFFEYFVINKHIEYRDMRAKDKYEKWKTNYPACYLHFWCGRHHGIVVSELDPRLRVHIWDLSWSIHGQNTYLSQCLSPPGCNNCLRGGGNLVMDWHPIQRGMMMHLVTSYEGKQDSLGLGGLLYSRTGLTFHLFSLWMFLFLKKYFARDMFLVFTVVLVWYNGGSPSTYHQGISTLFYLFFFLFLYLT